MALAGSRPPLSDLRVLIGGFYELSLQASAPAPAPEPPARATASAFRGTPAPVAPVIQEPQKLYSSTDSDVVPPVVLRQQLPSYPGQVNRPMVGAVEVVIDENGYVIQAMMRASVVATYDRQVLGAAQNWRYKPATLNGTPVKFRKVVQVAVTPPQ